MIELQLKTVIFSVVFAILWIMFFTIHRNYHIDRTRQRLFFVRAELFNAALEGKIQFDDPAYQLVRQALNGMIRFTHNLSFLRWFTIVLVNRYAHKNLAEHFNDQFNQALRKLSKEQKKMFLQALADAHTQILRHLMSVSLFWVLFKPLSIVLKIIHKTRMARSWALEESKRGLWRRFDVEATYNSYEDNDCSGLLAT